MDIPTNCKFLQTLQLIASTFWTVLPNDCSGISNISHKNAGVIGMAAASEEGVDDEASVGRKI